MLCILHFHFRRCSVVAIPATFLSWGAADCNRVRVHLGVAQVDRPRGGGKVQLGYFVGQGRMLLVEEHIFLTQM